MKYYIPFSLEESVPRLGINIGDEFFKDLHHITDTSYFSYNSRTSFISISPNEFYSRLDIYASVVELSKVNDKYIVTRILKSDDLKKLQVLI